MNKALLLFRSCPDAAVLGCFPDVPPAWNKDVLILYTFVGRWPQQTPLVGFSFGEIALRCFTHWYLHSIDSQLRWSPDWDQVSVYAGWLHADLAWASGRARGVWLYAMFAKHILGVGIYRHDPEVTLPPSVGQSPLLGFPQEAGAAESQFAQVLLVPAKAQTQRKAVGMDSPAKSPCPSGALGTAIKDSRGCCPPHLPSPGFSFLLLL